METEIKNKSEEVAKSDGESKTNPKTIVAKKREPKNWDKIVKEFEEEEKKDNTESADDVFKKMYSDADEDTRRAMNKSFVESNGTTLSMDWKKVGKKFVKPYDEKDSEDDFHSDSDEEEVEGMQRFRFNDRK